MTIGLVVLCALGALGAFVLAPAAALAQTDKDAAAEKSRSVRITTRAPEPDKWLSARSPDGLRRVFKCKPLSCIAPTTVAFIIQKGAAKPPNPDALDRLANIDLPKSIRATAAAQSDMANRADTVETLGSSTSVLKNFPAVLNETKISQASSAVYIEIAIIFSSPIIVRVEAKSSNRDLAQKSLTDFIAALQIEMGPLPPAQPKPRPPKTQSL